MSEIQRDLASTELWNESLERSLRRRALAPIARKRQARKKRTSLVAGAAVATAPMLPSLSAADAAPSSAPHDHSKSRRLADEAHERILLRRGDTSPAVGELQKALSIPVDDIFGPQTETAVRDLQRRAKLPVSGKVDARTWLTLFPTDAIISVTGPTASGSGRDTAQWAAVTVPTAGGAKVHPRSPAPVAAAAKALDATGGAASEVGDGSGGVGAALRVPGGNHQATTTPPSTDLPAAAPQAPSRAPRTSAPTTVSVPGSTGGQTVQIQAPTPSSAQSAAELVAQMIAAADAIDAHHYAYRWGGGHNSSLSGPYDCSGAVSAVLHAAGLVSAPLVSGDYMHWGAPGPGTVTIYANASHVYMSIDGRFFGTSYANAGGGAGWFKGSARPGFVVVHVPFEQMHLRPSAARVKAARTRRDQRRHATAVAAVQPRTSSSTVTALGGGVTTAGGTAAPAAPPQTAPGASAGTPATLAPSSGTPATVVPSTPPATDVPSSSTPATVAPTPAPEAPSAAAPVAAAPAPASGTPAAVAPTTPAPAAPPAATPVASAPTPAPAAPSPTTDTTTPASAVTEAPASGSPTATADPAPLSEPSSPVASDSPSAPATPAASDASPATSAGAPPASAVSDESTTQGAEAAASPVAA